MSTSSELSSIVSYCLLCTNPVHVQQLQTEVEVEEDLSRKTPNPGSSASAGACSSSPSPPAKLISHEQCSFVLFRHVLGRNLPPNICNDTQIKLCKNDSQIKYCNSCLTQLTHIHDLVAQLARVERELKEQKSEIALKFCSSKLDPPPSPNSATSAAAPEAQAARLPENERRQEFMELRNGIFGGLKFLKPQSILAIVQSLKKCHRKRPTLNPALAHAQRNFHTRFGTSNSASSSAVRLMKNVSIPRLKLRTRAVDEPLKAERRLRSIMTSSESTAAAVLKSMMPAKTRQRQVLPNSFPTDPLAEDIIQPAHDPSPASSEKNWLSDSDSAFCVGVKVEGVELEESAPNSTGGVQMAYLCGECGAIFKDRYSLNHHDDEAHRHHDDDDDAKNLLAGSSVRSPPADATFALPTSTATATTTTPRRERRKQNLAVQSKQLQQRKHKCPLCPAKLAHSWTLKSHLMAHSGEKPFRCAQCPTRFLQVGHLKRHQSVHTGDRPFQCPTCLKTFKSKSYLRRHSTKCCPNLKPKAEREPSASAIGAQPIQLELDSDRPDLTTTKPSGNARVTETEPTKQKQQRKYKCHLCPAEFRGTYDVKRHLLVHSGEKPFQCPACLKAFKSKWGMRKHSKRCHPNGQQSQDVPKWLPSNSNAPQDTDSRPRPSGVQEDIAIAAAATGPNMRPPTPTAVGAQPIGHHQDNRQNRTAQSEQQQQLRKHKCTLCPSTFGDAWNLKRHLLVHTGDKPFPCTLCPAKFTRARNLKKHLEVHTRAAPFEQHECRSCSKSFKSKRGLEAHLRSCVAGGTTCSSGQPVHVVKNYTCSECPAKFTHESLLSFHVWRVHAGDKPFPCLSCPASFFQERTLQSHLVLHTGEKPFQCPLCPVKFALNGQLQSHLLAHAIGANLQQQRTLVTSTKMEPTATSSSAVDAALTIVAQPPIGAQPNYLDKQIPFIDSDPNPTPSGASGTAQPANATAVSPTTESESCGIVILEEKFVPDFNIQAQI